MPLHYLPVYHIPVATTLHFLHFGVKLSNTQMWFDFMSLSIIPTPLYLHNSCTILHISFPICQVSIKCPIPLITRSVSVCYLSSYHRVSRGDPAQAIMGWQLQIWQTLLVFVWVFSQSPSKSADCHYIGLRVLVFVLTFCPLMVPFQIFRLVQGCSP